MNLNMISRFESLQTQIVDQAASFQRELSTLRGEMNLKVKFESLEGRVPNQESEDLDSSQVS